MYLVMELCQGGELNDMLKKKGNFKEQVGSSMFRRTCAAEQGSLSVIRACNVAYMACMHVHVCMSMHMCIAIYVLCIIYSYAHVHSYICSVHHI